MQILPAELPDLTACYKMTASYTTDYVWQLQTLNSGTRTDIRFDRVRPASSDAGGVPRSPDELLDHWEDNGCFLVARNLQDEVIGYLDAEAQPWEKILWVRNLVVDKPFRRKQAGSALLGAARRWAIEHDLSQMMLEMQTKNWPAISFAQKHGFAFCGFNERYYTNGDITLYFYHNL